jgi:hypothetical protein
MQTRALTLAIYVPCASACEQHDSEPNSQNTSTQTIDQKGRLHT